LLKNYRAKCTRAILETVLLYRVVREGKSAQKKGVKERKRFKRQETKAVGILLQ